MKTRAIIERGRDGSFSIYTPDLNNTIVGEGATIDKAREDFLIGVQEMRDSYTENGEPLPRELENLEFEYEYDTAALLEELSEVINMAAFSRQIGINPSLLRRYKRGLPISPAQAGRIKEGVFRLGKRLATYTIV